jgi:hypothetical protein
MHARYRKKGWSQEVLNKTVDLCRPCHSAVHKWEDEATLAAKFNTLDLLLEHPSCESWVLYVSKQRVSSKQDKIRYRR